jgi:hypothetical protein
MDNNNKKRRGQKVRINSALAKAYLNPNLTALIAIRHLVDLPGYESVASGFKGPNRSDLAAMYWDHLRNEIRDARISELDYIFVPGVWHGYMDEDKDKKYRIDIWTGKVTLNVKGKD